MAAAIPYTYYQCPCSSETRKTARSLDNTSPTEDGPEADEDERDFDPKAPRANYSLYPLEHLLYCEGCQQIRCERCVNDEIVTLFCPQCLFETPSSFFQKEGYAFVLPRLHQVSLHLLIMYIVVVAAAANAQSAPLLSKSALSSLHLPTTCLAPKWLANIAMGRGSTRASIATGQQKK
jgi:hypothetical protein